MPEGDPAGSRVLVALRVAASPERAFAVFTERIGDWWQPNPLFSFSRGRVGRLAFESGPAGRLVERYDDGSEFTIGRVRRWNPPHGLVVSWRQDSFGPDQQTELHVTFTPVDDALTRVVVEHFGWDTIPAEHAARHGFPLGAFQQRYAEWWHTLLEAFSAAGSSM
jgi:uncharacterized protein YndB with AHSA1/START domain